MQGGAKAARRKEREYLAIAEANLERCIPTWRTDTLEHIGGNLVNISPSLLPDSGQHSYGVLWKRLHHRDATELMKHLVRRVLAGRSIYVRTGCCPACGKPNAEIREYDMGRYMRIIHRHAEDPEYDKLFVGGKVYRGNTLCYFGPRPLPETYEGDL